MRKHKKEEASKWSMIIDRASEISWNNKERLKNADQCGCYYCCRIFDAKEVHDYCSDTTAMCPYCGIGLIL